MDQSNKNQTTSHLFTTGKSSHQSVFKSETATPKPQQSVDHEKLDNAQYVDIGNQTTVSSLTIQVRERTRTREEDTQSYLKYFSIFTDYNGK